MDGILIKGVGGLYTAWSEEGQYLVKARGKFRKSGMPKPMVGDRVAFEPALPGDDYGAINAIAPRVSCLERPPVANIDLLLAVVAAADPEADLMLADRLLLKARMEGIAAVLVVNKSDLRAAEAIVRQYELSGFETLAVSAATGQGIEPLRERLRGHVSAFAGQSAVGKSSLLNALCEGFGLQTGSLSRIQRGRHTTRHVELLPLLDNGRTWVADTPGFSLLESDLIDPLSLKEHYTEYAPYCGDCRFQGCNHINEPGCAVKQAVAEGLLCAQRHERYAQLYAEANEKWGRRYD